MVFLALAVLLRLVLDDVLEDHVDVIVEASESADNLLVTFHDDPDSRADALVDQFEWQYSLHSVRCCFAVVGVAYNRLYTSMSDS